MRFAPHFVLSLFMTALAAPVAVSAAPIVRTEQGKVRGVVSQEAQAFLGLPYAAPPVGPRRWREPAAPAAWSGVRLANHYAPACYQAEAKPFGPYTAEFLASGPFSEDCLYLNVWTPRRPAATGKWPVLMFIHGGAFLGGAASVPAYDGARLAARGAVIVTINYRANVFGFLAHPGLTAESPLGTSGNYGLLDQIAALQWVQRNIARFGGDPMNVTLSGESAGAASVNDLIVSPFAKGLFQKAISFSGASMAVDMPSRAEGEATGLALAARLGVPNMDALRAQSAAVVLAAMNPPSDRPGPPVLRYVPYRDGIVVPGDPTNPTTPVASPVPVITGFNAAEMIDLSVRTPADLERSLRARYGSFADLLLALYPHATDAEAQAANALIARDRYMTGLILWARGRAAAQPVYPYLYDHPYPPSSGGPAYGAFHSSQLPFLFGNLGLGGRFFGPADAAVSRQMQDDILAFMRTGIPGRPGGAWRAATPQSSDVNALGAASTSPVPAVSSAARFEAFRAYAAGGGALGLM